MARRAVCPTEYSCIAAIWANIRIRRMARATDASPEWGGGLNISWHPTAVLATILSLVAG
jgi:hypothetical protein